MMISSKVDVGQIWLTYLRFLDHPEIGKVRPILIIGLDDKNALVLALKVTSKPAGEDSGDMPIKDWQHAGLRCASSIRLDYVFQVPFTQLLRDRPLGSIDDDLLQDVLENISKTS